MTVGASVACQTREHQAKAVQKFRTGAEGTADARHSWALVERKCRRYVEDLVHRRFCRLGHAPTGIGGQRVQIPPGTFRVQDAKGKGGFPGSGDAGDSDDFVERDVDVDVFQVVDAGAADFYVGDHGVGLLVGVSIFGDDDGWFEVVG